MSEEKPKPPVAGQTPTLTSVLALAEEMLGVLGPVAVSAASGSVPAWRVPAASIRDTACRLRDAGWDYLLFVTAVDYPAENRLELVYALASYADGCHVAIVTDLDRAAPAIDTVSDVWAGADWHERETYDMFGVVFRGHPFLRRILLDEEWPGHPLRKDYVDTLHDVVKRPY